MALRRPRKRPDELSSNHRLRGKGRVHVRIPSEVISRSRCAEACRGARQCHATNGLDRPPRRLPGLLQRPLVRVHRPSPRGRRRRELEVRSPPRRRAKVPGRLVRGRPHGQQLRDRISLQRKILGELSLASGPGLAGQECGGNDRALDRHLHGYRPAHPDGGGASAGTTRTGEARR